MIIKSGNYFWSDEGTNGARWVNIPDSAINYDIWTREPSRDRCGQLRSMMSEAYALDQAEFLTANPDKDWRDAILLDVAPRAEVIRAMLDYRAMAAYESFRLAVCESAGQ